MKNAAQGAKFTDERSSSLSLVVVGRHYGQGGKAGISLYNLRFWISIPREISCGNMISDIPA